MIFLACIILATAIVITIDELSNFARKRCGSGTAMEATGETYPVAGDPPRRRHSFGSNDHAPKTTLRLVSDAYDELGGELDRIEFEFPPNVKPIHHRRSMAHPHLRVVPDPSTIEAPGKQAQGF